MYFFKWKKVNFWIKSHRHVINYTKQVICIDPIQILQLILSFVVRKSHFYIEMRTSLRVLLCVFKLHLSLVFIFEEYVRNFMHKNVSVTLKCSFVFCENCYLWLLSYMRFRVGKTQMEVLFIWRNLIYLVSSFMLLTSCKIVLEMQHLKMLKKIMQIVVRNRKAGYYS